MEKRDFTKGILLSGEQYEFLLRLVQILSLINTTFGAEFRFSVSGLIKSIIASNKVDSHEFILDNDNIEQALADLRNDEVFEALECPDCGEHYVRPTDIPF